MTPIGDPFDPGDLPRGGPEPDGGGPEQAAPAPVRAGCRPVAARREGPPRR